MRIILSLLTCLWASGCGTTDSTFGPEPTGVWTSANPTQQTPKKASKAQTSQVIVPAIDISRR